MLANRSCMLACKLWLRDTSYTYLAVLRCFESKSREHRHWRGGVRIYDRRFHAFSQRGIVPSDKVGGRTAWDTGECPAGTLVWAEEPGGRVPNAGWLANVRSRASQGTAWPVLPVFAWPAGFEQEEKIDMENLWLVLFWTGPIGIGIFLAGLGVLFWGIAQARKSEQK
jgi:hypothetical protein